MVNGDVTVARSTANCELQLRLRLVVTLQTFFIQFRSSVISGPDRHAEICFAVHSPHLVILLLRVPPKVPVHHLRSTKILRTEYT